MELCPKCQNEILPYNLRTGELIDVEGEFLVKKQLFFCVHCRKIYYVEHEKLELINLNKERVKELIKNGITSKARQFECRNPE